MGGEAWLATLVGTAAGICSTVSFVPQLLKAWREADTAAISKRTYAVTVTAFTLWIGYGALIGSVPILLFNAVSLTLAGAILALKVRGQRRGRADAADGGPGPVRAAAPAGP